MIRPRWYKVLSDLWGNKPRSILVVASIAVGLYAIGIIATMYLVLKEDMSSGYAVVNPANIQMTVNPFDEDLVERAEKVPGVAQVEAVRSGSFRLEASPGEWIRIDIKGIKDPEEMDINRIVVEQGKWPPDDRELVLDRYKMPDTNAGIGDKVRIELPSGRVRELEIVGVVHDQTIGANNLAGGFFLAPVQGYVTLDTMEWLEQPGGYNQLHIVVDGDRGDIDHINTVSSRVRDEVEDSGYSVYGVVNRSAYDHPNSTYVDAISGVLILLGLFIVFLSAFLVTNTLSALLSQQMQQIGIIKTVGGRRYQIAMIYMMLILVYGILSFVIAFPLAQRTSFWLLDFLSTEVNFTLQGDRIIPLVMVIQVVLALVVPQLAGFVPILRGTQVSVQEAISGFSQGSLPARKGRLARLTERVSWISRPVKISLRNAFRRKGRLFLTLVTLTLGGTVFIATFNVQVSLVDYIERMSKYFLADVNLTFDRPYRIDEIRDALHELPEVASVEGWAQAQGEMVLPDGSIGETVPLMAPPVDSELIEPILIEGRWIQPGDQHAIVLSERFHSQFPHIGVGDSLRLRVNGKEEDWVVTGFFQLAGKSGGNLGYTAYDALSETISQPYKAKTFRVVATQPNLDLQAQKRLGQKIEQHLQAKGYIIIEVDQGLSLRTTASDGLIILTAFLLFMAGLTALVGSIGLAGTMSLNVLERTREIGVMRAVGATNPILMRMVIVEGVIIGMVSWVLAVLLAFPLSKLMADTMSIALFDAPSNFVYTPTGFVIWLGLVLVLSVFASVMPARNAANLTIREVLAYE